MEKITGFFRPFNFKQIIFQMMFQIEITDTKNERMKNKMINFYNDKISDNMMWSKLDEINKFFFDCLECEVMDEEIIEKMYNDFYFWNSEPMKTEITKRLKIDKTNYLVYFFAINYLRTNVSSRLADMTKKVYHGEIIDELRWKIDVIRGLYYDTLFLYIVEKCAEFED